MKKIFKIIIFFISFFTFLWINISFAWNEEEQLEMIERYINTQKKNIKSVIKKYNIKDEVLEQKRKNLEELQIIIEKIKDSEANKEQKEEIIKFLTKNLKNLNSEIKEILRYHKEEFEKNLRKIQEPYNILWKKISLLIDKIIVILEKKNLNNKNNSLKEKLKNISKLFKNFKDLKFSSEEEIKTNFKKIINETKITISELKKVLKD